MTDKEKIIAYIDKLLKKYPKNYYLLTVAEFIDSLKDEPVSDNLKKEIENFLDYSNLLAPVREVELIACYFANWQKEQFEKNRLAACDRQTEEEAEREQDFVMGIIENEHRQPTFDDAIKYGMRLQKEKMMAKAINGYVIEDIGNGDFVLSSDYLPKSMGLKDQQDVKVIVIKED